MRSIEILPCIPESLYSLQEAIVIHVLGSTGRNGSRHGHWTKSAKSVIAITAPPAGLAYRRGSQVAPICRVRLSSIPP